MTTRRQAYLDDRFQSFVDTLCEWLKIPSISAFQEHGEDVYMAAEWVRNTLVFLGFPLVRTVPTNGHPLVYAEWEVDPEQPTFLIYGHYDVQPVDPVEEWDHPPFSPTVDGDCLYCRGASDDKGQVMLVLAALEAWVKGEGRLPINIKILLEGEEEAGGAGIDRFVKSNGELLKCDGVLICDTQMVGPDQPSLITGLRGILYAEIAVSGAVCDLHSGSYGGVAPNPVHALCLLLSRIKGEDGVINIPELQAFEPEASEEERKFWKEDPLGVESLLCKEMGVNMLAGDGAYPPLERLGVRPTFEVHGIRGGFTGDGAKTVIPAEALAKVSLRLPAGLDPNAVFGWLEKAVHKHLPAGHRARLVNLHGGRGVAVSTDNDYIQAAVAALTEVYGKRPVFMREGGSIPVAALFDDILQVPVVLMGFGLADDRIHAPNEKFSLGQYRRGMHTVAEFFGKVAK